MNKNKIAQYFFYFWLLVWPWQTKLILRSSDSPYLEISFFLSFLILLAPILIWSKQIITDDYWRFNKESSRPWWYLALIFFELITFVSIFWAEDLWLAFYRYLILVLGIFLFYLVKNKAFIKSQKIIKYFLIGLIPSALLAIWQFFTQSTFAFKYLGLSYHSAAVLGDSVIETAASRVLRAYGSFDHPNILGGMMVLGIILLLYSSLRQKISRRQEIFYLITLTIFYLALLVSFSRSAVLAFLISVPLLLIIFWRDFPATRKKILLYLGLIVFTVAIFILPRQDLFLTRVQTDSRLELKSVSEREAYFNQALDVIKLKPLSGTGIGGYINEIKKIDNYSNPYWYYQPVHNYWLLILSELGVVGFISMLIFWGALFFLGLKNKLWPIVIALFVLSLFDHWLWTQNLGILAFFVTAGLFLREDV